MKKALLSLAAAMTVSAAFAGSPQPINLGYDIGEINNDKSLSSFELTVNYSEPSTLTLDTSKKITIESSEGGTFESSKITWDRTSKVTVTFTPAVTDIGVYTVFIPEALFVAKGGTLASTSANISNAFTIGNPPAPTEDIINIQNMNASLPIGNKLEVNDPEDYEQTGRSGKLTGATGAQYNFSDVLISDENETMFTFAYNGQIYNTTAPSGYIQSVSGCSGLYFSTEPITSENYWNADYAYTDDPGSEIIPDGPAKYFYFPGSPRDMISEIVVKWGDEAVVGTVKTPVIEKNNWNDTRSGTVVTAQTYTNNAMITMFVKSSTGIEETVNGTPGTSSASYTITGEPGTVWDITAWGTKDGYNASEEATVQYVIDIPTLDEPYIEYPMEDWGEKMPVNGIVTISNWNGVGTLYYTVNGGETVSTEESEVMLRAVGQIGDAYELEAWVEAEGYNPSEKAYIGVYLTDNKLPVPTFSPNGGAVLADTEITIEGNDNTAAIVYRINGGEWMTIECFPWMPATVTISEDCLLEAYASAGEPEWASYVDSDIASANFVIEKLGENEVIIDKATLGISMMDDFYTTENIYGTFEYFGWTMDNTVVFVDNYYDEGEIEYNEWMRNTEATQNIRAIKANMVHGAVAAYLANEKYELNVELFNDDRDDYVVLGQEVEGKVSAGNGEWLELEGTKFEGNKFFFMRGYGQEASAQSIMFRFGNPDSVQTIGGLTEKDARYFGLDGIEVNGNELKTGIYIRVLGSKAEKVVVTGK